MRPYACIWIKWLDETCRTCECIYIQWLKWNMSHIWKHLHFMKHVAHTKTPCVAVCVAVRIAVRISVCVAVCVAVCVHDTRHTHLNAACRTKDVMHPEIAYLWMRHAARIAHLCILHIYECSMPHERSNPQRVNESRRTSTRHVSNTYECAMPHEMSHAPRVNESCRTSTWHMSHT